jgi:hypothetical protein
MSSKLDAIKNLDTAGTRGSGSNGTGLLGKPSARLLHNS